MHPVAFDFETELIAPGRLAPKAVCLTYQKPGRSPQIEHALSGYVDILLKEWLTDPRILLVGNNVAYDLAVACANYPALTPFVFQAYEEDRVACTKIRQQLLDIASGTYRGYLGPDFKWLKRGYSLYDLTKRHAGRELKKDGFRLFYGFLRQYPIIDWPHAAKRLQEDAAAGKLILSEEQKKELPGLLAANVSEATTYPLEDAVATLEVYLSQEKNSYCLQDQFRQSRAAWWLHLMSAWGIHTNHTAVQELKEKTNQDYASLLSTLVQEGLVRKDGTRDTKAAKARMEAVCEARGLTVRRTEKDQVALDADSCDATEDPILEDYGEFGTLSAVINKDIPMLEKGVAIPIQSRFDIAETGRTTSSNPNLQNLRRV